MWPGDQGWDRDVALCQLLSPREDQKISNLWGAHKARCLGYLCVAAVHARAQNTRPAPHPGQPAYRTGVGLVPRGAGKGPGLPLLSIS
jgi:hypothetical protein